MANAAIVTGVMAASAPPAIIISAAPLLIISVASPIAFVLLAHADVTHRLGPLAPKFIATCPAAVSGSIIGTMNGLTRLGPFLVSIEASFSRVLTPPIPVPIITPVRVLFESVISRSASSSASSVAATAN